MRRILSVFTVVAIALVLAAPAEAQFARSGVTGTVTDPDGAALPGVTVTVTNEASGFTRTAFSSGSGGYVFNGLTPGLYTITFQLQGFVNVERLGVELRVGQSATLDVVMELGGIEETITVTAQTPLVETTSKEVGGEVTTQEFQDLPSQNRSFVMFARLLPGVNARTSTSSTSADSLYINGQDDNNNSFNVDGANNDDDVIGARAGAQTRTALEAIQELQILTTQFDAEFGRTQGGVINAVTKSGGNNFHGSGFFYYQNNDWNRPNFFVERNDLDKPDFTVDSIGGTIGGPIVQNVAHFFVSIERSTPDLGVVRNYENRPDLNFSATTSNEVRNWIFKGDWQAAENHKVSVRYLREYSPQFDQYQSSRDVEVAAREEDDTDQNIIGSIDSVLSDRAFNNFRLSWTQEAVAFANPHYNNNGQDFAAQRSGDVMEFHPTFNRGTNEVAQNRVNDSYQVDDAFSYYVADWGGDHDMRAGINYSHRIYEPHFNDRANGVFEFNTDRDFNPSDITTYPVEFNIRAFGEATADIPGNNAIGLFYQDDWQPIENLTLNLGLRYDWETIVEDNNNIAPRLGFTWDPLGEGRTAVRGGFGRFYERFQIGFFGNFFLDAATVTQGFFVDIPEAGEDQQFFFDFAQANGITTLNALRDALAALIEGPGSGSFFNPNPTVDNPSRRSAYADTFSIGAEHEFVPGLSFGADFVRTKNNDVLVSTDLNPFSSSQGGRPDISIINGEVEEGFSSIRTYLNAGESTYKAIMFSARRRMGDSPIGRVSGRLSYTYADQSGTTNASQVTSSRFQFRTETGYNFDTGEIIGEAPDLGLDDPQNVDKPSSWHRDHIFALSGTWLVPGTSWRDNAGLMISGIYEWRSGDRWEVLLFDRLDNGNRQIAPPGTYDANTTSEIALDPVDFNGRDNGAEEPSFSRLDLSFRYAIPIQSTDLTILFDIYNISDRVNFSNHGSSFAASGSFLIPSRAEQPREFQVGAVFRF